MTSPVISVTSIAPSAPGSSRAKAATISARVQRRPDAPNLAEVWIEQFVDPRSRLPHPRGQQCQLAVDDQLNVSRIHNRILPAHPARAPQ